ncbi:leucine-rich repeat domain-containing protein [Patescibacteria group bacterium]|nr:leucine-rich repeat domain-containing protein [Patescibacteria group bacterium]
MKRFLPLFIATITLGAGCSANVDQPASSSNATQSVFCLDINEVVGTTVSELNLSGKGLTSIPMDVFSRTNLLKLDLSQNELTGAPQSQIGQLKNLTTLNLSKNNLTGLPAELGQLSKLEVLNVSNNKLTGLPMELGNLTKLRILDISGNPYSAQDLQTIAAKIPNATIIK